MIVKAISSAIIGIESYPVSVEVDLAAGLPLFSTVGLPDVAVRESKDRIKAAIKNSGYAFPGHHVTVNLAPADIRKEGTAFDLPIAVAILAAQGLLTADALGDYLLIGELSLDGGVKGVHGALSAAFQARDLGIRGIILPRENAAEAVLVEGIAVIPVERLSDVVEFFGGRLEIAPVSVDAGELFRRSRDYPFDFNDIRGQEQAKRALEVAAAGGHNMLMIGPPGAGKTMLAQRLVTILPDLSLPEAIETTKIFSVAGLLDRKQAILGTRPFRAPHHTISDAGLVGGGHTPRPGEISLAHHGVLFLDELPEFRKNVLEALRQPLEDGTVTITRSSLTATFPARFMLVAAMNPCLCGYYGDRNRPCRCTPQQIRQYQGRISGPLLDRIDIHCEVPSVRYRELTARQTGEPSAAIKARIERARELQKRRFAGDTTLFNARMSDRQVRAACPLDEESRQLIEMAVDRLGLSARAYTRILKVARTIADLEGEPALRPSHVAEAIQYRSLDRRLI
ncbi:MAG: YifB family Mg chelatase-like AAA ATPase [Proteobacteria bacterium]|nr:YifB family Mg chelatase-like AAA ATPase [Pseudomonadota bacterium]MBU2226225.1 YifB family Mg chelatase-like AAA ATPase [Pseudomonadota bacterium]